MLLNRMVEYVFFFGLMAAVGYLLWLMFLPFITALSLAAVIVTICYPMYELVKRYTPRQNESVAAFISTLLVLLIVIFPLAIITSMLISESVSIYRLLNNNGQYSMIESLRDIEDGVATLVPGLELDLANYLRQGAQWFAGNLGVIFAGTASTIFSFFIAMIGSFYFFRDGRRFMKTLIKVSPLSDLDDELILQRMGMAIRGVATGTVLIAIVQGISAALGFSIFGFDRAVLFGTLVALVALVPGIGSSVIFIPAAGYLAFTGDYFGATGLVVWWLVAVSFLDNILGPYLISRSHPMHPFLILLSVLGGLILFGPIGFIVGPVITSVFIVLLEIYSQHIASAGGKKIT